MFIFFFLLWIILNGRITLEIVLFGLAIAALITTVVRRMTPLSAENERMLFRNAPLLLVYVLNLILEIIKASLQVMTVIWNTAKNTMIGSSAVAISCRYVGSALVNSSRSSTVSVKLGATAALYAAPSTW